MNDRDNGIKWNEYFYPGTNILINNVGIKDPDKLKEFEATYSFERLLELRQSELDMPIDKNRLNFIHHYIFEDIYPFAGKYRRVNMAKAKGTFYGIDRPEDIDQRLDELFEEINGRINSCYSVWDFCDIMAKLYTALIYIHPYREGNGRSIREFMREYSLVTSEQLGFKRLELDWTKIDKEQLDQYIEVVHLFPSSITSMFENALVEKNRINKR